MTHTPPPSWSSFFMDAKVTLRREQQKSLRGCGQSAANGATVVGNGLTASSETDKGSSCRLQFWNAEIRWTGPATYSPTTVVQQAMEDPAGPHDDPNLLAVVQYEITSTPTTTLDNENKKDHTGEGKITWMPLYNYIV